MEKSQSKLDCSLIPIDFLIIVNIQVCLFRNGNTGMAQYFTEGVDIHAVHQASFGKVIPQTMWGVFFTQSCPCYVFAEVTFKVAHTDGAAVFFDREKVITFHISVFELELTAEGFFCFGREEHCPLPPTFGFLRPQIDTLAVQFQVSH